MRAVSISDYRELAQRRLPRFLFDYIDGGSYSEMTLRKNVADLQGILLRQKVLRDVSDIDLSTELFDQELSMPVVLGPVGLAGMYARRGEVQAAKAAVDAGITSCLSTLSICTIKEVSAAVGAPFWFQLYMTRDRHFMHRLLDEAERLACSALVFTVDMPVAGIRYRDYRSGLAGAPGLMGSARRLGQILRRPAWALDVGLLGRPHVLGNVAPVLQGKTGMEDFFAWIKSNFEPKMVWKDLEEVRRRWKGPVILKGILDPDDAKQASDLGVDGIIVSNHGGRQLDGASSTARALPAIAAAVGDRVTVLADGGVRSGIDVLRMLALGAKGVLLGRAWAYALAAEGKSGVAHVLQLIDAEMRVAMALTGVDRPSRIDARIIDKRVM